MNLTLLDLKLIVDTIDIRLRELLSWESGTPYGSITVEEQIRRLARLKDKILG
jgi:hypothetical protein